MYASKVVNPAIILKSMNPFHKLQLNIYISVVRYKPQRIPFRFIIENKIKHINYCNCLCIVDVIALYDPVGRNKLFYYFISKFGFLCIK